MKNLIVFLILSCLASLSKAQSVKSFDLKGHVMEVADYKYDKTDPTILKKPKKSISKFDKQGNVLENIEISSTGEVISKSEYVQTNKKNVTVNDYDKNSKLTATSIFVYNDNHQLIEFNETYNTGKTDTGLVGKLFKNDRVPLMKKTYKYDKSGNVTEEDSYFRNVLHDKRVILYNKSNVKVEENGFDKNGTLTYKSIFKYDKSVNLIESEINYTTGNENIKGISQYSKHDKYGNWLSQTYQNNSDKWLIERVVKYY